MSFNYYFMPSHRNQIGFRMVFFLVMVSFLSGTLGGALISRYSFQNPLGIASPKTIIEERRTTYIEESNLIEAREKVAPAVVSILGTAEVAAFNQNRMFFFDPFGFNDPFDMFEMQPKEIEPTPKKKQSVSAGTGFIISSKGLVVTNKHVVNNKDAEYVVVLSDGKEYKADIKSKDPLNDLAVLQMKPKNENEKLPDDLPVAELGDSDSIRIGQRVIAIGNALAEYQNTTTAGIISATGREIRASDTSGRGAETLTGLMQTDAAINLGNSGGPLVSLDGKVIGINTAIDAQANGIGFAIPINDVKPALASLDKYGKIIRPILGVRYIMLTEDRAKELNIDVKQGAFLVVDPTKNEPAVVPGGAADKAGLKNGDVILEIDGQKLDVNNSLQKYIRGKVPGDKVVLKIWRDGKELLKNVVLGQISEDDEIK